MSSAANPGTGGSNRRKMKTSTRNTLIAAAAVIIAAIVGVVPSLLNSNSSPSSSSAPSPEHTFPSQHITNRTAPTPRPSLSVTMALKPGSIVPECTSISGAVTGPLSGKDLWLFLRIGNSQNQPTNTYYFLAPLHSRSSGQWSADVHVGDNKTQGMAYWIEVISSDPVVTGPINIKDLSESSYTGIPVNFDKHPLLTVEVWRGSSNSISGDRCISFSSKVTQPG
jgi:hypothetical protein